MSLTYPLLLVFPFVMLYAAAMDVLTMRIANTISLGLVAAFFVVAAIAGMPAQQMLVHVVVGLAVLIANLVLFQLRLVGGKRLYRAGAQARSQLLSPHGGLP